LGNKVIGQEFRILSQPVESLVNVMSAESPADDMSMSSGGLKSNLSEDFYLRHCPYLLLEDNSYLPGKEIDESTEDRYLRVGKVCLGEEEQILRKTEKRR
jgi:hypothetical protein